MWKINETTNNLELDFLGKLVSIGSSIHKNTNGTEFLLGSVELPNKKIKSCRIYKKNYDYGMTVGETYMATATQYEQNGTIMVDITVSHLTAAERAVVEDFESVDESQPMLK